MNDQTNTAIPPTAGEPSPEDKAAALAANNAKLFAWLSPPTAVFLQGVLGCLNNIHPAVVLLGVCEVLGRIIGHMYAGQPQAVVDFRNQCVKVFSDALLDAVVRPLPQANAPAQTNAPDADAAA